MAGRIIKYRKNIPLFVGLGVGYGGGYGGELVECCQYRVDPLLLLGLIAAIGGLTFFLQQQGKVSEVRILHYNPCLLVVANINGKRSLREESEESRALRIIKMIYQNLQVLDSEVSLKFK